MLYFQHTCIATTNSNLYNMFIGVKWTWWMTFHGLFCIIAWLEYYLLAMSRTKLSRLCCFLSRIPHLLSCLLGLWHFTGVIDPIFGISLCVSWMGLHNSYCMLVIQWYYTETSCRVMDKKACFILISQDEQSQLNLLFVIWLIRMPLQHWPKCCYFQGWFQSPLKPLPSSCLQWIYPCITH